MPLMVTYKIKPKKEKEKKITKANTTSKIQLVKVLVLIAHLL